MFGIDQHSKLCVCVRAKTEGKNENKKGKKNGFVFVGGQCLLEGNDTIVSIHSHTSNICSHDWSPRIHPNHQDHSGISKQLLSVVE